MFDELLGVFFRDLMLRKRKDVDENEVKEVALLPATSAEYFTQPSFCLICNDETSYCHYGKGFRKFSALYHVVRVQITFYH